MSVWVRDWVTLKGNLTMSNTEFRSRVETYLSINRQIKSLDNQLATEKEHLIQELDSRKAEELSVGQYNVSNKAVASSRVDVKRLKEHFPDVAGSAPRKRATGGSTLTWRNI